MNEISKYLTTDAVNTNGSSRIGSLNHMKYNDILKRVGPPTIYYDGAHDKVNVEWIFKVNGDIFTIYDYKAWSETYTFNELNHWSVGGFANTDKNMQILIDYLVLWTDKAKINRLLTKEYE
tara:strand:+ start:107 stop:469 length:363 start_codon:yes stop_codon:yes gene_type:complete